MCVLARQSSFLGSDLLTPITHLYLWGKDNRLPQAGIHQRLHLDHHRFPDDQVGVFVHTLAMNLLLEGVAQLTCCVGN